MPPSDICHVLFSAQSKRKKEITDRTDQAQHKPMRQSTPSLPAQPPIQFTRPRAAARHKEHTAAPVHRLCSASSGLGDLQKPERTRRSFQGRHRGQTAARQRGTRQDQADIAMAASLLQKVGFIMT